MSVLKLLFENKSIVRFDFWNYTASVATINGAVKVQVNPLDHSVEYPSHKYGHVLLATKFVCKDVLIANQSEQWYIPSRKDDASVSFKFKFGVGTLQR